MRIWDIHPGYLNRQSLLGEHRELHGIVSIFRNRKKGYANHPETLRWAGYGWALRQRHRLLAAEMALRGYTDKTPVRTRSGKNSWPTIYIDDPFQQLQLLRTKYQNKEPGRIQLPKNGQQIWRHHKYSVLARSTTVYKQIGRETAAMRPHHNFSGLAARLTELLRRSPAPGGLRNALLHMWGHISDSVPGPKYDVARWSTKRLIKEIQRYALAVEEPYLMESTALSELAAWLPGGVR